MAQTSMAYFSAEVEDGLPIDTEHQLRLAEAESAWLDDAGFGDGQDPHNARLFRFPEDFGLTLMTAPMLARRRILAQSWRT